AYVRDDPAERMTTWATALSAGVMALEELRAAEPLATSTTAPAPAPAARTPPPADPGLRPQVGRPGITRVTVEFPQPLTVAFEHAGDPPADPAAPRPAARTVSGLGVPFGVASGASLDGVRYQFDGPAA